MLKNYFKIALRNFASQKVYSSINVMGLALGITSSVFIILWIISEHSYDSFHENKDNIYQIMVNHRYPDGAETLQGTPGPLSEALHDIPEISQSFKLRYRFGLLFNYNEKSFYENGIFAEASILDVLTIKVLEGDRVTALRDFSGIAISSKLARKYFGGESAIGKVIKLDTEREAKVTLVFDDLPVNSSLKFEFVIPYAVFASGNAMDTEWGAWVCQTFVKLNQGQNNKPVDKKINDQITKPKIWPRWDSNVELFLFPMNDFRLYNKFENGVQVGGRITYVRGFTFVAIFILMIACINFMNLSTARSVRRSKEVGLRKVVGASRTSLIKQFIAESFLYSILSLVVALLLLYLLTPYFNNLTGTQVALDLTNPTIIAVLVLVTLSTGFLAGSYPAFFLSRFQPAETLKGTGKNRLTGAALRKTLVVFQFGFSVLLIICALVVYQQMNYLRNKNLGFDRENAFYFIAKDVLLNNYESFRAQAEQHAAIRSVGRSDANPMDIFSQMDPPSDAWPGKTKNDGFFFRFIKCDYDFLNTLNFTIVKGRNFSRDYGADSTNFIINEAAAKLMRLDEPVGQRVKFDRKGEIVGVVKDFHSTGLQGPIEPVIIAMRPIDANRLFVRYEDGNVSEAVDFIRNLASKYQPDFPIEETFMDEPFGTQYEYEILIGKLFTTFTFLAIFISALGLFGLAAFTTERRSKEIGIRKVMGATTTGLVFMLCKDFIKLAFIAFLIGAPIGLYFMNDFLKGYAFHTDLNAWIVLATALIMLGVTLLVVAYQSLKAAMGNPVEVIRTE